ncbi:MAG TPA: phosphoribosyltransferase family protein [Gaiellaceae bacterium]|nr:phosphoribosyltransferase family protein [Gaiellaceae bacterium]
MERRLGASPLFLDRTDAGRRLGEALLNERGGDTVVVGLARGGVQVAAEVARALDAPLDVVAVRKVRHPWQPEYALGAVTPGDGVYVRGPNGLSRERLAQVVAAAKGEALELDRRLHARRARLGLEGKTVLLVDDGLATGATMIAAARWAKGAGAGRVVAAVPVASADSAEPLRREVDGVVALATPKDFLAVALWYAHFPQIDDEDVLQLLDDAERPRETAPGLSGG